MENNFSMDKLLFLSPLYSAAKYRPLLQLALEQIKSESLQSFGYAQFFNDRQLRKYFLVLHGERQLLSTLLTSLQGIPSFISIRMT